MTVCMWRPEDDVIKLLFSSHLSVGSGLTSGCQTCTANALTEHSPSIGISIAKRRTLH